MAFEARCVQLQSEHLKPKKRFNIESGKETDVISEAYELLWGNDAQGGILPRLMLASTYDEAQAICAEIPHDTVDPAKHLAFNFLNTCSVALYEYENLPTDDLEVDAEPSAEEAAHEL